MFVRTRINAQVGFNLTDSNNTHNIKIRAVACIWFRSPASGCSHQRKRFLGQAFVGGVRVENEILAFEDEFRMNAGCGKNPLRVRRDWEKKNLR